MRISLPHLVKRLGYMEHHKRKITYLLEQISKKGWISRYNHKIQFNRALLVEAVDNAEKNGVRIYKNENQTIKKTEFQGNDNDELSEPEPYKYDVPR